MTHQDIQALAPEYVMGTLDAATRSAVLSHLATCPECRAEVAAVAKVSDAMARSVDALDPPAGLRDRIAAIPAAQPQAGPVARASSRRVEIAFRLAAGLILTIALWQWAVARQEVQQLRARVAALQADSDALLVARASLQQLEAEAASAARQANVLGAADLLTFALTGQDAAPGARARAYVSQSQGLVFAATGLPAVPAGRTYQLWLIVNAKPVNAGLFRPDADGHVHTVLPTPAVDGTPAVVAVTLEPEGGLPQPSGAMYLAGAVLAR